MEKYKYLGIFINKENDDKEETEYRESKLKKVKKTLTIMKM